MLSERRQTRKVSLPGGQDRLRQAVLYVAAKNAEARYFGRIKLNKVIWRADFRSYRERGKPVTGREYRRQALGPVPWEMPHILRELQEANMLSEQICDFGDGVREMRPVALVAADLSQFTADDLSYFDEATAHYWSKTGQETSDESHGIAWRSRYNGDPMPYESALLSDKPLSQAQAERLRDLIADRGLISH